MNHPSSKLGLPPDLQPQLKGSKMRRIFAGLAMASFMMLGISTAAHAQQTQPGVITCDEGGNPPNQTYDGTLILSTDGDCTLESVTVTGGLSISAGGNVTLNGPIQAQSLGVSSNGTLTVNGAVTTDPSSPITLAAENISGSPITYSDVNITSGASFSTGGSRFTIVGKNITSTVTLPNVTITSNGGGTVNVASLQNSASVTNTAGDINVNGTIGGTNVQSGIQLTAGQSIGVGNITVTGPINANYSITAPVTVSINAGGLVSIGAVTAPYVSINSNKYGISGAPSTLSLANPITATGPSGSGGVIVISNGSATGGGVGNITDTSTLSVNGTTGNTVELNAFGGTLTLPAGTIDVPGALPVLWFQAKTIHTAADTTLSVTIPSGSASKHKLRLDTDTLNYDGNLTLLSNGNATNSSNGFVYFGSYSAYYSLPAPNQIQFNGAANAALSMKSNGNYDYVQVSANVLGFNSGGAVTMQSQGATSHYVDLNGATPSSLAINTTGPFLLDASGVSGAGNNITVAVGAATINSPTFTLNANGPATGDGAGGKISYTATSTTLGSSTQASLTANAASGGTGNAVYGEATTTPAQPVAINFQPGTMSGDLNLGTGLGQFSFSANGGKNGGNAGTVYIKPTGNVSLQSTQAAVASALGGTGDGGWIYIDGNIGSLGTNVVSSLSATGYVTGYGGKVTAAHTLALLDVDKQFKVDAGLTSASTAIDGIIQLNGVTCQQFKTTYYPFPTTYWDCANSNPTAIDQEFANFAQTYARTMESTLSQGNTKIHVFADPDAYESFFQGTAPDDINGVTFRADTNNVSGSVGYIYSSFFESTTTSILQADQEAGHEFGHAADATLASPAYQSQTGSTFNSWAISDFFYLDYTDTDAGYQPRDPCKPETFGVNTYPAPFANNIYVCDQNGNLGAEYANMSNSEIAMTSDLQSMAYIFTGRAATPGFSGGYLELYANSIAFAAFDNSAPPSTFQYLQADKVIASGFFGCTSAWGAAVLAGSATPPASPSGLSCGSAVPGTYQPGTNIQNQN